MSDQDELTPAEMARLEAVKAGRHPNPLVEITADIDLPPHLKPARDQHEYDPRVLGDNSNITFAATAKEKKQADVFLKVFFKNAKDLHCPRCSGDTFRIFTDDAEELPTVMIICHNTRCGACWMPVHLQKAQVSDVLLNRAGFWMPE